MPSGLTPVSASPGTTGQAAAGRYHHSSIDGLVWARWTTAPSPSDCERRRAVVYRAPSRIMLRRAGHCAMLKGDVVAVPCLGILLRHRRVVGRRADRPDVRRDGARGGFPRLRTTD